MPLSRNRRSFLSASIAAAFTGSLSGCGLFLHPERRGQRGGRIDWRVAALDGLGLLLFFVPGIIAFAVDFHEGTIFLPEGHAHTGSHSQQLVSVFVPPLELTRGRIETVVSSHVNQSIDLNRGEYQTQSLEHVDDFWSSRERLMSNAET